MCLFIIPNNINFISLNHSKSFLIDVDSLVDSNEKSCESVFSQNKVTKIKIFRKIG